MWRDVGQYVRALAKHWTGFLTGAVASLLLLVYGVFEKKELEPWQFFIVAGVGIIVAGFQAWREERAQVQSLASSLAAATAEAARDPELELRRPRFEKELAKLSPREEGVLWYVVQGGDCDAEQLRDNYFAARTESLGARDTDALLATIANTAGFLERKGKSKEYEGLGINYSRYGIKPVWSTLLVEWAAAPTPTDKRIIDKATDLRRMLAASFEGLPPNLPTLTNLTDWAGKLLRGQDATEARLKEMVELRADASRRVEREVGTVRDAFYNGTGILNRLFKDGGLSIPGDQRQAIEEKHREAVANVRRCLDSLDKITRTG